MGLFSVLWVCSSYSSPVYTYGYTGNAAADAYKWQMSVVMDQVAATDINGVVYQYTAVKEVQDDMVVSISNKDNLYGGYIFRESDDWSGRPGGTINRFIVLDNIPADRFGEGSIEIDGIGSVVDASVVYTYRIDTTYDTGNDLVIPDVQDVEIYDALSDQNLTNDTYEVTYSDDEEVIDEEDEEDKDRLEKGLAAAGNSLTIANAVTQAAMLDAINRATNVDAYYAANIQGGTYRDVNQLIDSKLPENKRGLRNGFAQQVLHDRMVEMQYR